MRWMFKRRFYKTFIILLKASLLYRSYSERYIVVTDLRFRRLHLSHFSSCKIYFGSCGHIEDSADDLAVNNASHSAAKKALCCKKLPNEKNVTFLMCWAGSIWDWQYGDSYQATYIIHPINIQDMSYTVKVQSKVQYFLVNFTMRWFQLLTLSFTILSVYN